MPIDPSGTAPGLTPPATAEETKLFMKCKRPECKSNEVVEVRHPGSASRRLYRCVKCHTSWGIMTGGPVDL